MLFHNCTVMSIHCVPQASLSFTGLRHHCDTLAAITITALDTIVFFKAGSLERNCRCNSI